MFKKLITAPTAALLMSEVSTQTVDEKSRATHADVINQDLRDLNSMAEAATAESQEVERLLTLITNKFEEAEADRDGSKAAATASLRSQREIEATQAATERLQLRAERFESEATEAQIAAETA